MAKWIKSNSTGVRYRLHGTRKHGVAYDRYFSIRYRVDGKVKEEGLGWASEGWTDRKAAAVLAELKANQTTGKGPKTLNESREIRRQAEQEEVDRIARENAVEEEKRQLVLNNIFANYCDSNAHKKSLKDEINYFKNWIKPAIGSKRLDEIILLDLERIRKKMTTAGKAPRSIQYVKSIIRQVYHHAAAHQIYSGDVPTANFLKKERNDNRRQRYLSPMEAEQLLEEVRKHSEKTYQISLLSLHTGMRFGEIAALLWQHVKTDSREILVIDPKNGETRSVFMTDRIVEMFKGMQKGKPEELVFPSENGNQRIRVSNAFATAVDDLGFNKGISDRRLKVVFHSLRHSCASILVNAGVEIPVIARILGHKTLAMTMRYSHVNDTSVRRAMSVLDAHHQPETKVVIISSAKTRASG